MNFIVVVILLVAGWFIGEAVQDSIVEKCTKGETFVVKHQKFRCIRADLKGATGALIDQIAKPPVKNPEDE